MTLLVKSCQRKMRRAIATRSVEVESGRHRPQGMTNELLSGMSTGTIGDYGPEQTMDAVNAHPDYGSGEAVGSIRRRHSGNPHKTHSPKPQNPLFYAKISIYTGINGGEFNTTSATTPMVRNQRVNTTNDRGQQYPNGWPFYCCASNQLKHSHQPTNTSFAASSNHLKLTCSAFRQNIDLLPARILAGSKMAACQQAADNILGVINLATGRSGIPATIGDQRTRQPTKRPTSLVNRLC